MPHAGPDVANYQGIFKKTANLVYYAALFLPVIPTGSSFSHPEWPLLLFC
jgi:hypothetical protein